MGTKRKTNNSSTSEKAAPKKKGRKITKIEDRAIFQHEIERFIIEIDSLEMTLNPAMDSLSSALKKATEQFVKFTDSKHIKKEKADKTISFYLHPSDFPTFKRLRKEMLSSVLAISNVPQILFCSLVHVYDAHLGRLLRSAFYAKPEILNSSEKSITFADLVSYANLEDARETLVQREIESVIRESHVEQFAWMEKKFGITLTKDLDIWPIFVELTERRNLFVHCGGVITPQYLSVCKKHGVNLDDTKKVGEQLTILPDYFRIAFECIYEISVKLGHVLWRKLRPDELEKSSSSLYETTFELLSQEKYHLAIKLLKFSTEIMKKHASDLGRRVDRINLAIAYKFSGKTSEMKEVLLAVDWSACGDNFKLAVSVLNNEYDIAANFMKAIGTDGKISKKDYASWPLFKDFRNTKEFLQTYKELFGDEFILTENNTESEVKNAVENAGGKNTKSSSKQQPTGAAQNVAQLTKAARLL